MKCTQTPKVKTLTVRALTTRAFKLVGMKVNRGQKNTLCTPVIIRRHILSDRPEVPKDTKSWLILSVIVGVTTFVVYVLLQGNTPRAQEVDWLHFKNTLLPQRSLIEKIEIDDNKATIKFTAGHLPLFMTIGDPETFVEKVVAAQTELGIDIWDRIPITHREDDYARTFSMNIPSIAFWALIMYVLAKFASRARTSQSGGLFGMTNYKAKLYQADLKPKVTFDKIAGLDEAKVEVMEFVHFLKHPKKYLDLGATIPRGCLLVGPPGTGKTLIAKAVAGEAGVPFFSISGSEFMEMFVGVGPARVRDLFDKARQKAPCIIFIDEIDAVGRKRDKSLRMSNDERENTLNQLLVEMDGFNTKSGVIVLAGTNRPDVLDPALTRPGRFDRTINIDPPDIKGRRDILKVHLKPLKLENDNLDMYAEKIATLTPGMSGADLQNICNEAALIAARTDKPHVQMEDLEAAIDRVIGGFEKKDKVLTVKDRKTVAFHEAGHAVVGWFLEHANPLLKVSIIPRGRAALGYAQYQPKEQHIYTKSQLFDQMCVLLGGRLAEELAFGSISTGASDDLKKVTNLAYQEVVRLGFNEQIGLLSFKPPESDYPQERLYSQTTQRLIDEEVRKLVTQAQEHTRALLQKHKDHLFSVAERLLQKEKIGKEDMIELLGERPWKELRSFDDLTYGRVGTIKTS